MQNENSKSRSTSLKNLLVICGLFLCAPVLSAKETQENENNGRKTISIEYLRPTKADRNIKTVNIDFYSLIARVDKMNLSIYAGIVGTYATGDITQLEGNLNQGTLRNVNYKNSAFGVGPGVLFNFRLIEMNQISLSLNGSGHVVIYSERFPAGGDYYNFMWRGGVMIEYEIWKNKSIGISYQDSHISNGQGFSQKNPSYDGSGFSLRYTGSF